MTEEQNKYFTAGFALALAEINRQCDRPDAIKIVMDCANLDLQSFENAGVDEYDMEELRKAFRSVSDF